MPEKTRSAGEAPPDAVPADSAYTQWYEVKKGDTLWKIAKEKDGDLAACTPRFSRPTRTRSATPTRSRSGRSCVFPDHAGHVRHRRKTSKEFPMKVKSVFVGFLSLVMAAALLAGCANQMEPAKKAIADIEAAVGAAGPDAAQYIPDQLQAVTSQIADLKMKFDQKDYKAVIATAPALLAQAQGLAAAGLTAKQAAEAAALEALNAEWGTLATDLPAQLAAVTSRAAILSKSKKLPAGLDAATFDAAKSGAAEAATLWEQATAAQAAGNVEQAVTTGRQVKDKLNAAMAGLGMSAGRIVSPK